MEATRELLAEVGYQRLTYDAVAQRAGVHRPAVYRRWPSKPYLVNDACVPSIVEAMDFADTGNFENDLRSVVSAMVKFYSLPHVTAGLAGMLGEVAADKDLLAVMLPRFETDIRSRFVKMIDAYASRGEIATVNAPLLLAAITSTVFVRLATLGVDDGTTDLVDDLSTLLIRACRL